MVSTELLRYSTPYQSCSPTAWIHGQICPNTVPSAYAQIFQSEASASSQLHSLAPKSTIINNVIGSTPNPLCERGCSGRIDMPIAEVSPDSHLQASTLFREKRGVRAGGRRELQRQDDTRLPNHTMFRRSATQGAEEAVRSSKQWGDRLQENLHALGAASRKRERRQWFVHVMKVKENSQD